MSWQVEYAEGVWLPQVGWWLDARHARERSFVSHAHFDHLALHREILCSPGTARLMRARLPGDRREHVLPFGQTEPLTPEVAISLHPAGHIHGSAQCLLEHPEWGRLLYTGDFKLRPGRAAEPCATPRADVLVMETTFGRPQYRFPPTSEVIAALTGFCLAALDDGETPVLYAYSLGKSQELLWVLAEHGLPVMLHPQTRRMTQVYADLGLAVPPHREYTAGEVRGHVVLCPPQSRTSPFLRRLGPCRTAVVTGWALDPGAIHRHQCDAAFPLSDHADFDDLLRFVEQVNPRRVYTLHGFARDFASTLRERGIEAWALSEENQLDLSLGPAASAASAAIASAAKPAVEPAAPSEPTDPLAFAHLAAVADKIAAQPRRHAKVALLADYLATLPQSAAAIATRCACARTGPAGSEVRSGVGWALLRRGLLERTGLTEAQYRADFQRFPDAGDAAEAALRTRDPSGIDRGLTLPALEAGSRALAAARGPAAKLEQVHALLIQLGPTEAKYLIKLLLGDLRIGLKEGLVEDAIAQAWAQPAAAVREAHLLAGDLGEVAAHAAAGTLAAIGLRPFQPLRFMLATPAADPAEILARLGPPVWLEEKYDGIRCQVHRRGGRVELYSRDLKPLTAQFPELARAAATLPEDFIGDAELLAWRDGRALPFAELQRRLGRRGDDLFLGAEIPVSLSFYDLLWHAGQPLIAEPLRERRRRLEGLLAGACAPALRLAPVRPAATAAEIEAAFLAARRRGNEGLMAKDPASPYSPGRRGLAWLKLKRAGATLDVVVVAVEQGHGKRRDVLSDYTFAIREETTGRLLVLGKAYTGLTDAEIARLTDHFLATTTALRGRRREVLPQVVLEIAFDAIQASPRHDSGLALRFPRIVRLRPDKTPAEIDTLAHCRRLAEVRFDPEETNAIEPAGTPPQPPAMNAAPAASSGVCEA
ncbi:MAG: DNA ligase [Opitutia bacterium Tous-C8FEB]|nr:MAG: DNA ligase [Opitutae bacterium Tous-C8FEB]